MMPIVVNPNGTFDVRDGRRVLLAGACAEVAYRTADGAERILRVDSRVDETTLRGAAENVELRWTYDGETARVALTNHGAQPLAVEYIDVLVCTGARLGRVSDLAYLQHGWQSWSPVRVRALNAPDDSYDGDDFPEKHLPHGKPAPGEAWSEWFTLIQRAGARRALGLGFVTAAAQLAQIRIATAGDEIGCISARCHGDGARLAPGATLRSEQLWLASGEPLALLEEYAARLGAAMHARLGMRALSGWCTWYYFYGQNSDADVSANIAKMQAERLPLDLILLDDGYQTAIGDWTSLRPEKFSRGMRAAADEIRRAGKIPGLWLAPFGAARASQLAQEHPEFLLRDAAGQPVLAWTHAGAEIYALDLTQPGTLEHLRQLLHTVCFDWGYDLVKLDFIYAGAAPGAHHDPTATRAQAFRRGLQAMREAIGEDKIILGCGAPQAASVGLVDAMRIGQDVNFYWQPLVPDHSAPAVSNALQNCIWRAPFQRRLWVNDPDCVIVRARGDLNALTAHETRTLLTVLALTGGVILDGDHLPNVPPARLDDLRRLLPPLPQAARARDLFDDVAAPPRQLELHFAREWGEWHVLAALNWGRQTRAQVVELPTQARCHVYDLWQRKYLGAHRGRIKLTLAPHQTALLIVALVTQEPRLIATTFHISGGAAEVKAFERNARGLRLELEKAGRLSGELIFALPARWEKARAKVGGRAARLRKIARGVYALRLTLDERAVVEVQRR